jgi:hypothetical protein
MTHTTLQDFAALETFAAQADAKLAPVFQSLAEVANSDLAFTKFADDAIPAERRPLSSRWSDLSEGSAKLAADRVRSVVRFILSEARFLLAAPFEVELPTEEITKEALGGKIYDPAARASHVLNFKAADLVAKLKATHGGSAGKTEALKAASTFIFDKLFHAWVKGEWKTIDPKTTARGVTVAFPVYQDPYADKGTLKYSSRCDESLIELGKHLNAFGSWALAPEAPQWEQAMRDIAQSRSCRGNRIESRMKCELGGITLTLFRESIQLTFSNDLATPLQTFMGLYREEAKAA